LQCLKENKEITFDRLAEILFLEEEILIEILSDFWSMGIISGTVRDRMIHYSLT